MSEEKQEVKAEGQPKTELPNSSSSIKDEVLPTQPQQKNNIILWVIVLIALTFPLIFFLIKNIIQNKSEKK